MHFVPQLKVLDRVVLQVYGDLTDRGDDLLQEDLQDRVWSGEPAAHFSRLVQQVLVLVLQTLRFSFADSLRPLIRHDFIILLEDEVDVAFEFLVEPLKVSGQVPRRR